MSKLRLRIARLALALGGAALCWACNAPFIPIPPPGQTATFTSALVESDAGTPRTVWVAHGPAYKDAARARFYIFDMNVGAGVIAEAADDGSYASPPMDGAQGDRVQISYETPAGALSTSLCFQLTEEIQTSADGPSAPKCQPP